MAKMKTVWRGAWLWLCLMCVAHLAWSGEPASDPLLRIETGRHTATINHIATDAQNRWLATASQDKTVRLWDMRSGALLQTLRLPVGDGNEGKLYSLAMAPDGEYLAVGGWTGWQWDGSATIYIFHRPTGRLVRRIPGMTNLIRELAWSPDGRWLAVGLGLNTGVRVYRNGDFSLAGEDRDYGGDVYGLEFDRRGRLVSSSKDGYLRLHQMSDGGLRRLAKNTAPGGTQPYAVRFSPDGQTIAVGFQDTIGVNVLAADSLNFLFAPDVSGLDASRSLDSVSWSADGYTLYAGGRVDSGSGSFPIRTWPQSGRGPYRDLIASASTIFDIRPLAAGGVVFGTSDPAWGLFDSAGQRRQYITPAIADFRAVEAGFRLSYDGQSLRFGFDLFGKSPIRFNVAERRYQEVGSDPDLLSPRLTAPGIDLQDWKNGTAPKLNGRPLGLQNYETARAIAIDPAGQGFVVGAEWTLRRMDASGREIWQRQVPGVVWAVNISGDGRFVVVAYGDGTIRWHRYNDGRELLAFFPHADKKRWVLWTPSGFFDASPGGEDLIGWHLNRGKENAADFFAASRFRSQFYRPDVVAKIIDTRDEAEALRLANLDAGRRIEAQPVNIQSLLPPVVDILSPGDGSSVSSGSVTLRFSARTLADAPVTGVRVRVNGQAVALPESRNLTLKPAGDERQITVPIPQQDSEIQVFAENRNGVSSPASLRLKWVGSKAVPVDDSRFKPKLYVLAVGVSKYANPEFNLGLAAKDARDFAAVLSKQKGRLYGDVQVRVLTDAQATKDDVMDGLEWLKQEVTAKDVGMVFLAGHGVNDNTGNYYFMPYNGDPNRLLRTGVAQGDIKLVLNSLPGKAVFFVDTCHSGNALGTAKTRSMGSDINAFVNELASAENGVVVFTAATGKQLSLEDASWGNGAFTKAVIEGLSGRADFQKNGKITHKGLDYYVAERVKELTKGRQAPVSIAPAGIQDFPIAIP